MVPPAIALAELRRAKCVADLDLAFRIVNDHVHISPCPLPLAGEEADQFPRPMGEG